MNDPLQTYESRCQVVGDLVTGVAKGYKTALYLYGEGGNGKSHTVLRRLEELPACYQLHNSRVTAKGLFQILKCDPYAIHVFEDVERLTKDPHAQGTLRSACWAQPGHPRLVTWTTAANGPERFDFHGGIILISNRPLADLPELRALATRIEVHRLEASTSELTAKMRDIATRGYKSGMKMLIGPEECLQVSEHLLLACLAKGCKPDLRLQQKAFQTYLQWESDNSACHWQDLVSISVQETTVQLRHETSSLSREAKRAFRRNAIREVIEETTDVEEQVRRYQERTGASRSDFFRRKGEVLTGDFNEQDIA